jgi:hypothetical protein
MNTHLTQQIATQRQTEMRQEAARRAGHRQARRAHRAHRMRQASQAGHSHPVRRRAGYALISIGLRLAYAAGED